MFKKITNNSILILTILFLIIVYLLDVVSTENNNISKLIIPNNVGDEYFTQFILDKAPDEDTKEALLSYYVHEDGKYLLKEGLGVVKETDLKLLLIDVGYYKRLINRRLATYTDLIFLGYLGHFFKFSYFGVVSWLAIPITLWGLFKFKSLERWEKAYLTTYMITLMVVTFYGYDNSRYQLTLSFFSMPLIVYSLFKLIRNCDSRKTTSLILTLPLLFLIMFKSSDARSYINKTQEDLLRNKKTTQLNFLNLINTTDNPDDCVMVNNIYAFYYYTDRPHYYYWSHKDIYFENGVKRLLKDRDYNQAADYLINDLNCPYIITKENFNGYNAKFDMFITKKTTLLGKDGKYEIYKVNN